MIPERMVTLLNVNLISKCILVHLLLKYYGMVQDVPPIGAFMQKHALRQWRICNYVKNK